MGVPKFYRWLSERYPQINQMISTGTLLPEFDNLYLDMNGIIHACTHPNDGDPTATTLTFREMVIAIFSYIDRIVTEIVKPKKILFMAIDGVAPRAKLNQQRSRRFRSAQERTENFQKMREKGIEVDEENAFDSNCITPGTEFMNQVGIHLRWFIRKKIKEDALWRDLTIVFSGHDVPGEGEHKIMQFIREKRALPSYEPNQRHCMYGQDADLIMLGLASHEPHFALLREVVNFTAFTKGPPSSRQTTMRQTKESQFQLLHLSILREYIEIDLGSKIVETCSFAVDKERLIDDFIFLTFFVGNDFLPHLPTLDISEHAFDMLFETYQYVVSKTQKYFVRNGEIHDFNQVEIFCSIIGRQEHDILVNREIKERAFITKKQRCKDSDGLSLEEIEELEDSLQQEYEAAVIDSTISEFSAGYSSDAIRLSLSVDDNAISNNANIPPSLLEAGPQPISVTSNDTISNLVNLYFEEKNRIVTGDEENGVEDENNNEIEQYPQSSNSKSTPKSKPKSNPKSKSKSKPKWTGKTTTKGASQDEESELDTQWKNFRGRYYFEKFKKLPGDLTASTVQDEFLKDLIIHYVEGLTWCLAYYVKGCISWTWYYPHHYGPMLQDVRNLSDISKLIGFQLGQPFTPFQQLLGCLPPASRRLVPQSYQWLMTSAQSPCLEFYPLEFKVDMTHKKNPWEAVVLLPFINEKILLQAEAKYCPLDKLTLEERARNAFGKVLIHNFDPNNIETFPSCNPGLGLSDIHFCQSAVTEVYPSLSPGAFFEPKLIARTQPFLPGFPSLSSLNIVGMEIINMKLNIFGSDSKYKTLILEIDSMEAKMLTITKNITSKDSAVKEHTEQKLLMLLGKSVYVNYPQLHEAKIVGITTEFQEFTCDFNYSDNSIINARIFPYDHIASSKWAKESETEREFYFKGRGIPGSGGLLIGNIYIRLKLIALQGMKTISVTGERKKVFGKTQSDVPMQLVLWQHLHDPRFIETDQMPLTILFPHGCTVLGIRGKYLGLKGTVIHEMKATEGQFDITSQVQTLSTRSTLKDEHSKSQLDKQQSKIARVLTVEFSVPDTPEPQFGHAIAGSVQDEYFSSRDVCKLLKISPHVLGKIVGSIFAVPGQHDLGLNLKRNGQYQLLGYARNVEFKNSFYKQSVFADTSKQSTNDSNNVWGVTDKVQLTGTTVIDAVAETVSSQWEFTALAINLFADYKEKFPELFKNLAQLQHKPKYLVTELLGKDGAKTVEQIMEWMKSQPSFHAARTLLSTATLSREAMKAIEKAGDMRSTYLRSNPPIKKIVHDVPLDSVHRGDAFSPFDAPVQLNASPPLLGDRVVNVSSIGVPSGLIGTVVSIHSNTGYVEVIFDEEFVGGRGLAGYCSHFRGRLCAWNGLLRIPSAISSGQGSFSKESQRFSQTGSSAQSPRSRISSVLHSNNRPSMNNSRHSNPIASVSVDKTILLKSNLRTSLQNSHNVHHSVSESTERPTKLNSEVSSNNATLNPVQSKSLLHLLTQSFEVSKPNTASATASQTANNNSNDANSLSLSKLSIQGNRQSAVSAVVPTEAFSTQLQPSSPSQSSNTFTPKTGKFSAQEALKVARRKLIEKPPTEVSDFHHKTLTSTQKSIPDTNKPLTSELSSRQTGKTTAKASPNASKPEQPINMRQPLIDSSRKIDYLPDSKAANDSQPSTNVSSTSIAVSKAARKSEALMSFLKSPAYESNTIAEPGHSNTNLRGHTHNSVARIATATDKVTSSSKKVTSIIPTKVLFRKSPQPAETVIKKVDSEINT